MNSWVSRRGVTKPESRSAGLVFKVQSAQTGLVHRTVNAAALRDLLGGGLPVGRGPAYRDLAERLRLLVLDGRLPLQVSLPSERELAASLAVSRTTVAAAYALLREQGHLLTRPGARSRTTVPRRPGSSPPAPGPEPPPGVHDLAYAIPPAPPSAVHEAYTAALNALPANLTASSRNSGENTRFCRAIAEPLTGRVELYPLSANRGAAQPGWPPTW